MSNRWVMEALVFYHQNQYLWVSFKTWAVQTKFLKNLTALLAAIVSNTTMDDGRGMISNRAAIISSEELRTTTLISTAPNSSKTAPPKVFSEHLGQVASRQIASGAVCWQIYHAGLETPEGAAIPNPKVCPVEPLPL